MLVDSGEGYTLRLMVIRTGRCGACGEDQLDTSGENTGYWWIIIGHVIRCLRATDDLSIELNFRLEGTSEAVAPIA